MERGRRRLGDGTTSWRSICSEDAFRKKFKTLSPKSIIWIILNSGRVLSYTKGQRCRRTMEVLVLLDSINNLWTRERYNPSFHCSQANYTCQLQSKYRNVLVAGSLPSSCFFKYPIIELRQRKSRWKPFINSTIYFPSTPANIRTQHFPIPIIQFPMVAGFLTCTAVLCLFGVCDEALIKLSQSYIKV